MLNFSNNQIDDETAKLVSDLVKDGLERIELCNCDLTKQGITTITKKISNLTSNVSFFNINEREE